jgi:hypothetical protein
MAAGWAVSPRVLTHRLSVIPIRNTQDLSFIGVFGGMVLLL